MSKGSHTSVKNERLLATGKHKIYLPKKRWSRKKQFFRTLLSYWVKWQRVTNNNSAQLIDGNLYRMNSCANCIFSFQFIHLLNTVISSTNNIPRKKNFLVIFWSLANMTLMTNNWTELHQTHHAVALAAWLVSRLMCLNHFNFLNLCFWIINYSNCKDL